MESNYAPIDHHELEQRVERMFDESDKIIVQILSKCVDEIRLQEDSSL